MFTMSFYVDCRHKLPLVNSMAMGFGFHQDGIMGFKRGHPGVSVGICEFHLRYLMKL